MARIQVTVIATFAQLRLIAEDGRVFEYSPKDIVSIGTSIGGYLVAPMPGRPYIWGWFRLSGGQINRLSTAAKQSTIPGVFVNGRPLGGGYGELIETILAGQPERVAVNGRQYLFARSAGAARNGVLHPYRPSTDPIQRALQSVGCGDKHAGIIMTFQEADEQIAASQLGGFLSGSRDTIEWNTRYALATDGAQLGFHWHGGRGTVGRLDRVTDYGAATYIVQLYEGWNGVSTARSIRVALGPGADRTKVAQAIIELVRTKAQLVGPERKLTTA